MADDLSIVLGVELDESYDAIKAKINALKSNNGKANTIKLTLDSKSLSTNITNITNRINNLTEKPHNIILNIAGNAENQIQNIRNQLEEINELSRRQERNNNNGSRQQNNRSRQTRANGFNPNRRVWAEKYRDEMERELERYTRDLGKKGATDVNTRIRATYDNTGKAIDYRGIVTYRNEIGKTTQAILTFDNAQKKFLVTESSVNTSCEAQRKAIEGLQKSYDSLNELAFNPKNGLDRDSAFGQRATQALDDYQHAIEAVQNGSRSLTDSTRTDLDRMRSNVKAIINEQKVLRDKEIADKEESERNYLSDLKKNSKQLEYNQKKEASDKLESERNYLSDLKKNSKQLEYEQKVTADAQNMIANAKNELSLLEKATFSGSTALTGDFASKAHDEIQKVSDEFDKLKESAGKSVSAAMGVSKDGLSTYLNNLKAELDQLKKIQYPSDKLAAKDVETLKIDYSNKIQEFRNQLKEAGLESSDFTKKLDSLGDSLKKVGTIDGSGTVWAEWKGQFENLQAEFNKFQLSATGMGHKLAESIGSGQLEQVKSLSETLSSLPDKYSGSGVNNLIVRLDELKAKYSEVQTELQGDNLTDDQFKRLSEEAKKLDEQLKQIVNSAKVFNDDLMGNNAIEKYELDVENLTMRFEKMKQRYDEFVEANPSKASADVEADINAFAEALKNVDPTNVQTLVKMFRNLSTEINNTVNPAQSLSQILTQNLGGVGQYLARFVSATYIISKSIGVIKSMVSEVKSLDTSLMELQKVTTLSGNALSEFTDKAYKLGKDVGRTGKDVIDAVTTFSRAGYNLQESTQLAQSALVMTNVGVDIPNTEAAASDMISILKAFDKQADESMEVIDKLYNVANKEPLDFGNITQMLVTAGGTLAQTNTTLEETMGLLTGGFATLRDTSVANG